MSEEEKNAKLYASGQMLLKVVEELENRIDQAKEKLYLWGETLNPTFQKEMLEILGDEE